MGLRLPIITRSSQQIAARVFSHNRAGYELRVEYRQRGLQFIGF